MVQVWWEAARGCAHTHGGHQPPLPTGDILKFRFSLIVLGICLQTLILAFEDSGWRQQGVGRQMLVHTHTHTHAHSNTHTHTHLRKHTQTHRHAHARTHAHTHTHTYAPTERACARERARDVLTHALTHTHSHTHRFFYHASPLLTQTHTRSYHSSPPHFLDVAPGQV